jgi:ABC-type oligopeptide transport system substrate-binding subunit
MSELIDTLLGNRYHVTAEIGRGGMSVVYRAVDTVLDREVAIKVLKKAVLGTEGRTRLLSEAKAIAKLNHPNIVSVYDAGETNGSPYIVMELVEGLTLSQLPPESLDGIITTAQQICAALAHAHSKGIIHRDLKPANILLAPDGMAKLVDFGIARSMTSRVTSAGTILGTVLYLAPELALGQDYDGRADLYALGVMLYELTTGRVPFIADDPLAVVSQHLHAPVIPPRAKNDHIPPALDALIVNLLAKDPADRPASAAKVLRTLESPSIRDVEAAPLEELSLLQRIERGRLVGREQELEEAKALWSQVLSGQGQTLLISGEPGVGKTRLAREIATQVEISGGRALVGASFSEGGPPYYAFKQVVHDVLMVEQGEGIDLPQRVLADLLTLAPELRSRYPKVPDNPSLDAQEEQQRLLESLLIFVTTLSEQVPLMLIMDDGHWADSGTLLALRHLARHTRRQRVMLVITYQEVEVDRARPLHEAVLHMSRERLAKHIRLKRLSRTQTEELLAALFDEEITPEFLDSIFDQTEGNPFFIEEVVKALVESGKLYYKEGRWHRPDDVRELSIPHTVRVAIQSRVQVLSPTAQEMMQLAAVLGRQFELDTLAQASDLNRDQLDDAVEEAKQAQLVEESRGEQTALAFVHGLVATTLVDDIQTAKLRRLHRRVAEAIEIHRPEDLESLAYHYSRAGDWGQALEYILQAGDRARALYAHQEAVDNYQQALELLREAGDIERAARTLMKLGLTYHNCFEFKAARQAYKEGFALWQRGREVSPATPLPSAPHPLRVSSPNPRTLDPGLAVDDPSITVIGQLFSGLVELSPDMNVVPDVARHWEVLDGGRKYVFHLRNDVHWSDGSPVTAADFEYAWKHALDPERGSEAANYLHDIKGARAYHLGQAENPEEVAVSAEDDLTLVVELEGPTSYFLHLLTRTPTFPIPRHAVQAHGATWTRPNRIITNGPFTLAAWKKGRSLLLKRNPNYHGRFTGNVQDLELVDLGRPGKPLQRYQQDNLDQLYLAYLPATERHSARQLYAGDYIAGPMLWSRYICFDLTRHPFDDNRVRRAFTLATDRETLAHVVHRGQLFPATGGLVPPGMPGHSPGIGLPYDPEEARRLLAEVGYRDGHGFPPLQCLAVIGFQDLTEWLREQWLETLGVDIAWTELDWSSLREQTASGKSHMWITGWSADYPDPDSFLRVCTWRANSGWRNEEYNRLVEGARRTVSQEERMMMYGRADGILVDEAALLVLAYGRAHWLIKPWVTRFPTSPIGGRFWKDVIIEPH